MINFPYQIDKLGNLDLISTNNLVEQMNNALVDIYRKLGISVKQQTIGKSSLSSLSSNESVLDQTFFLNASNGVYQDVGISVLLPTAGTYLIYSDVRAQLNFSASGAGAIIVSKLYNASILSDVLKSEREAYFTTLNSDYQVTIPTNIIVKVTTPNVIKLYAKRDNATTWVTSQIVSDNNGRTNIGYVQIK